MLTYLFFYKLVFVTELLIAESIFTFKLRRRNFFWLRVIISLVVIYATAIVIPINIDNPFYKSFIFVVLFSITLIANKRCYKESWKNILFCAIAGYSVQHISFLLNSVLTNLLSIGNIITIAAPNTTYSSEIVKQVSTNIISVVIYLFTYINIYYAAFNHLAYRIKGNTNLEIRSPIFVFLSVILVLSDVFLHMLSVYYTKAGSPSNYIECILSILICVFSLILLFSQLAMKRKDEEYEAQKIIYQERFKQYRMSKENIDLINQKCHDLKHQLTNIRKSGHSLDPNELKEIENAISFYESNVETGNEALDVVLIEKSLLCQKYNINLSMIIDGSLLNFIEARDIFSLFGNALDNSIEALQKMSVDKRDILITVKKKNDFVVVHIENPFDGVIISKDGEIQTSKKEDNGYHGYGLLSMRRIVESYGGTLSIQTSNNRFALNIIFY